MPDGWIKWNGGDCPIKSDKTRFEVRYADGDIGGPSLKMGWYWDWKNNGQVSDIIAYRIIEDHEPKCYQALEFLECKVNQTMNISEPMTQPQTREKLTAQIEALRKQLAAMPPSSRFWYNKGDIYATLHFAATHHFDIETINGVPHINGVAMKEVAK